MNLRFKIKPDIIQEILLSIFIIKITLLIVIYMILYNGHSKILKVQMHDLLRSRFEGLVYLSIQQVVTKMVNYTKRVNKRNRF